MEFRFTLLICDKVNFVFSSLVVYKFSTVENLISFREEVIGTWDNAQIKVTQFGKIGIVNIINVTFSNILTTINLPLWFVSKKQFVSSLYSKEEKKGAEISITGNKMYVYISEKTTDLTGQIIVILN